MICVDESLPRNEHLIPSIHPSRGIIFIPVDSNGKLEKNKNVPFTGLVELIQVQ